MKEVPLSIMRGDSRQLDISVVDDLGKPVDITGAIINFRVAKEKTIAPQIELTNGPQVQIVDGTNGRLLIRVTTTDTDPLLGDYYYEVETIYPFGGVSTILYGPLTILQDIRVEG